MTVDELSAIHAGDSDRGKVLAFTGKIKRS